jgi:hypothetical protein
VININTSNKGYREICPPIQGVIKIKTNMKK